MISVVYTIYMIGYIVLLPVIQLRLEKSEPLSFILIEINQDKITIN